MNHRKARFWEVDFVRGVALCMMILYHLVFNLYYFGDHGIDANEGVWFILGRSTAILFVTIVGISLSLSYARVKDRISSRDLILKYLKRGSIIFGIGMGITLVTYLFLQGEGYVVFGVLHLIGLSVMISVPLLRYKYMNLIVGCIAILSGSFIRSLGSGSRWLLWLGIRPHGFHSVDYFPLLPWFGLVTLGIFIGKYFYPDYERRLKIPDHEGKLVESISTLGRNTLVVYLVHQPIIIAGLFLLGLIDIPIL